MRAKNVMTSPVVTVGPDARIRDIADLLMERRISAVPVVDDGGRLVGIVSEGDLMTQASGRSESPRSWWLRLVSDPVTHAQRYVKEHGQFAREVMTRNVVTVSEDATLPEIATLLEERGIKRVPVVRDGQVVGIVSRANLLQGLAAASVSAEPSRDDDALRVTLEQSIEQSGIRATFVNVVVVGGVAHLWGALPSREEREALTVIVEDTPGLVRAESHVTVFSPEVLSSLGVV